MILLVIDRHDGRTVRIGDDSSLFDDEIRAAARYHDISYVEAREILDAGQEIVTPSFVRKFEEQP